MSQFYHKSTQEVEKYQIDTTIVYVIGDMFPIVVTLTKNGVSSQVMTTDESNEYLFTLMNK